MAILAAIGAFSVLHILGFGLIYKVGLLTNTCLLLTSKLVSTLPASSCIGI